MIRLYSMLKWCAILTAVVLLSSSTMDNKSAVDDVISPTETISTRDVYKSSVVEDLPAKVHAVTDLSHHFSFYADNRFHTHNICLIIRE